MFINFLMVVFNIGSGRRSQELESGFCNLTLPRVCAAILDLEAGALLSDDVLSTL